MNVGQKELNIAPYKTKIKFANLILYCPPSPAFHQTPLGDDHQLHAKTPLFFKTSFNSWPFKVFCQLLSRPIVSLIY